MRPHRDRTVLSAVTCSAFFLFFILFFFFFQAEDGIRDVAVTGVQTCALPISAVLRLPVAGSRGGGISRAGPRQPESGRSEEHTSELQSRLHLGCRLLLEKKQYL